jgi:hypothetical protein
VEKTAAAMPGMWKKMFWVLFSTPEFDADALLLLLLYWGTLGSSGGRREG